MQRVFRQQQCKLARRDLIRLQHKRWGVKLLTLRTQPQFRGRERETLSLSLVGRPAPSLLATRPALAVGPEPVHPLEYEPWIHVNAHARMPYLRAVRSAHRIPASPYARSYLTGTQRLAGLRPSSQRHRAPVPQPDHAHEDHSPTQPPPGCPPPATTRIWNTYTWKLCRAPADHMGCQSTSGPRSFS